MYSDICVRCELKHHSDHVAMLLLGTKESVSHLLNIIVLCFHHGGGERGRRTRWWFGSGRRLCSPHALNPNMGQPPKPTGCPEPTAELQSTSTISLWPAVATAAISLDNQELTALHTGTIILMVKPKQPLPTTNSIFKKYPYSVSGEKDVILNA